MSTERPLIITDDDVLLDELLRIAAAAQVEVAHSPEPSSRSAWRSAGLILIGTGSVPAAVARGMPRRAGVVAVAPSEPADVPWDECIRLGVESTVRVGEHEEVVVGLLVDAAATGSGGGAVIAVVGGCGGAGVSVFCTALAVVADSRRRRVLLADTDRWGAGLDVVLGVEQGGSFHWQDVAAPSGRLSAHDLRHSLPTIPVGHRGISLLCHDRVSPRAPGPEVVEVVLRSGRRAGDLVVVDLPRHPDPAGDAVLDTADLVLLVVTADVRGCYGAARVAARLLELGCRPELVIRGPSPGGLGADDLGAALDLPIAARMRPQPFLARELEHGRVPGTDRRGPLARAASAVLDRFAPS